MIRKEKTEKREISNQWEESNADGRMDRRPNNREGDSSRHYKLQLISPNYGLNKMGLWALTQKPNAQKPKDCRLFYK